MDPSGGAIFTGNPFIPLSNPGIISIPLGFLGAWLGTVLSSNKTVDEETFAEIQVKAHTGIHMEQE